PGTRVRPRAPARGGTGGISPHERARGAEGPAPPVAAVGGSRYAPRVTHALSRRDARRIAVRAQLLDARRPGDVVEVVEQLTLMNIDPTNAIMPSEHHLLWSRIGSPYETSWLTQATEVDRTIFEFDGGYRPMSDLELF